MGHRKVTKGRDALRDKLEGIRGSAVTLALDGKAGEGESDSGSNPRVVVTNGGDEGTGEGRETADEWISREMSNFPDRRALEIEVVTADRQLRRLAHAQGEDDQSIQVLAAVSSSPQGHEERLLERSGRRRSRVERAGAAGTVRPNPLLGFVACDCPSAHRSQPPFRRASYVCVCVCEQVSDVLLFACANRDLT